MLLYTAMMIISKVLLLSWARVRAIWFILFRTVQNFISPNLNLMWVKWSGLYIFRIQWKYRVNKFLVQCHLILIFLCDHEVITSSISFGVFSELMICCNSICNPLLFFLLLPCTSVVSFPIAHLSLYLVSCSPIPSPLSPYLSMCISLSHSLSLSLSISLSLSPFIFSCLSSIASWPVNRWLTWRIQ